MKRNIAEKNLQVKEHALLKLIESAATKSARLAMCVFAVGSLTILLPTGTLDPTLTLIAGSFGVNAFSTLLDWVAKGKDISNEELLKRIECTIDENKIEGLLTENEFQRTLARLFERQDRLIRYVVGNSEESIAKKLVSQLEEYQLLHDDLRQNLTTISNQLDRNHQEVMKAIQADSQDKNLYRFSSRILFKATTPAPPHNFIGRRNHLDALRKYFTADQPIAHIALQGMAGIGKSATAKKLASELRDQISAGIFWCTLPDYDGNPAPILRTWYEACGYALVSEQDINTLIQFVRDLFEALRSEIGSLMIIIDDVRPEWQESTRLLLDAIPDHTHILITTRDYAVATNLGFKVYSLDSMPPTEAIDLFIAHANQDVLDSDKASANKILEEIGFLPLAIELIGKRLAFIGQKPGFRLNKLLQDVVKQKKRLLALPGHPGLAASFAVTYNGLSKEVQRLFRWLGVFTARPLYQTTISGVMQLSEEVVESLLDQLVQSALLTWGEVEERIFTMHPLLHEYAKTLLEEDVESQEAQFRHLDFHIEQARAHTRIDAMARYGITFDLPSKGQISAKELRAIYATLSGFSPEFLQVIDSLEQEGKVQLSQACYAIQQGIWTKDQTEMIILGSEQPNRILRGMSQPHQIHLYSNDLIHARSALLGGILDRILALREYPNDPNLVEICPEYSIIHLDIQFEGDTYSKLYRCEDTILIPWLNDVGCQQEIPAKMLFRVLVRARNAADLNWHLAHDIKLAGQLRKRHMMPTFIAIPYDFTYLPQDNQRKFTQQTKEAQIGLLICPKSVMSLNEDAEHHLARSRTIRQ